MSWLAMTFAVSESNTQRWRSFFAERSGFQRKFSFSTAAEEFNAGSLHMYREEESEVCFRMH